MTIFSTKSPLWVLLFLLAAAGTVYSQDDLTGYLQPQIAVNYNAATNYKHNFSLAQRVYFYDDEILLKTRQIDIVHFSDLKISADQNIALGVQYRFRNNFEPNKGNELRFVQQYNITAKPGNIRLGHRIRSEQRITAALTTHRFRYRFALDVPLQGEQLDVGETYLVASTEGLLSIASGTLPQYDQRVTINLGWLVVKNTKLQAGLEYRLEDYTHHTQKVVFLLTSLALSL